jgi:hypothetical protein
MIFFLLFAAESMFLYAGFEALGVVTIKGMVFWAVMQVCHLLLLVSCKAYSSTSKMGVICSSETLGFL